MYLLCLDMFRLLYLKMSIDDYICLVFLKVMKSGGRLSLQRKKMLEIHGYGVRVSSALVGTRWHMASQVREEKIRSRYRKPERVGSHMSFQGHAPSDRVASHWSPFHKAHYFSASKLRIIYTKQSQDAVHQWRNRKCSSDIFARRRLWFRCLLFTRWTGCG